MEGLGQLSADPNTSCAQWVAVTPGNYGSFGMSQTDYANAAAALPQIWSGLKGGARATDASGTPLTIVNGAVHFDMQASGGTIQMKYDGSTMSACAPASVAVAMPVMVAPVVQTSSTTPYIVAAVLGVLLLGGLLWAED